jgi:putative membrane protein
VENQVYLNAKRTCCSPLFLQSAKKNPVIFNFASVERKIELRHISGLRLNQLSTIQPLKIMKSNILNKIVFMLGISSLALPALANEGMADTNQPSAALSCQQFVSDAAGGGMKEIVLSTKALENSTNSEIKSFARRMIKDHSAANEKLMKIAQEKGLAFPPTNMFAADDPNWNNPLITNPETIKGAQLLTMTNFPNLADYQAVRHLQSLNGDQFDQAYVNDMAGDHAQAVSEFEMASQNLSDPDVKKFAAKTLPTLQKHSKMADELNDKYNMPGGTNMTNQPVSNLNSTPPM